MLIWRNKKKNVDIGFGWEQNTQQVYNLKWNPTKNKLNLYQL